MLSKTVAIMSRHYTLDYVFNIVTELGIVLTILWVRGAH